MYSNNAPHISEKRFSGIINSILDISVTHLLTYLQNTGSNLIGALASLVLRKSVARVARMMTPIVQSTARNGNDLWCGSCDVTAFSDTP